MAALTPVTMLGPFSDAAANSHEFTFAAGSTDGDTFACTGRQLLIIQNSGASPYTYTITATDDEKGRAVDFGPQTLGAGEFAYFTGGLTNSPGWKNSSTGVITLDCENVAIKYAILTLPAGYPG